MVTSNVDPSTSPLTPAEHRRVLSLKNFISIGVGNLEIQGVLRENSYTLAANCSALQGYCAELMVLLGKVLNDFDGGRG